MGSARKTCSPRPTVACTKRSTVTRNMPLLRPRAGYEGWPRRSSNRRSHNTNHPALQEVQKHRSLRRCEKLGRLIASSEEQAEGLFPGATCEPKVAQAFSPMPLSFLLSCTGTQLAAAIVLADKNRGPSYAWQGALRCQ